MRQPETMSNNEQLARAVVRTLQHAGYEAYFVGGCVRDRLLGREPDEFDVATSAPPAVVRQLFPHTVSVGLKFGVVIVVGDDAQVEVATFRSESGYADHRHPSHVAFSTIEEDAKRRDFTVNALYQDPFTGHILDFVGGRADLQTRILRAIGNPAERFEEDGLRVLRALRFAASLDFTIEASTWKALQLKRELIREIAIERIRDELIKGFTGPHPDRYLALLDESGLLAILLPEVSQLKGCEQPPEFHPEGDVFVHTQLMLKHLAERNPHPSPALAFAVLLHDIAKPVTATCSDRIRFNNHDKIGAEMADAICRRLAFPNDLRKDVATMVKRHMTFINLPHMRASTLQRFLAAPTIETEIEIHKLDCLASHGDLRNAELAEEKLQELRDNTGQAVLPRPLINGHDLKTLGFLPGPHFKDILRTVQDAQLEGKIRSREEALDFVRQEFLLDRTSLSDKKKKS